MAKYSFNITPKAGVSETVQQAKAFVQSSGGSFEGDNSKGHFSGKTPIGAISCQYVVNDELICITILKKPMVAPNTKIEQTIRKHLEA